MISGRETHDAREAIILLSIRGPTGRTLRVEATIDTGFTGSLSLRQADIDVLQLVWQGRAEATLADGRTTTTGVYEAHVMWDGHSKQGPLFSAEANPLVGMGS